MQYSIVDGSKLFMRQLLLILILLLSTTCYSQDTSAFRPFIKSFERNFSISGADQRDSCLTTYTLLKIDIDSNYAVSSIVLSDNTPDWQSEALSSIEKKLDLKSLGTYAKKNGLKDISLFFPFIIRKQASIERFCSNSPLVSNLFFRFDGNTIKGNCLFADRIELIYY